MTYGAAPYAGSSLGAALVPIQEPALRTRTPEAGTGGLSSKVTTLRIVTTAPSAAATPTTKPIGVKIDVNPIVIAATPSFAAAPLRIAPFAARLASASYAQITDTKIGVTAGRTSTSGTNTLADTKIGTTDYGLIDVQINVNDTSDILLADDVDDTLVSIQSLGLRLTSSATVRQTVSRTMVSTPQLSASAGLLLPSAGRLATRSVATAVSGTLLPPANRLVVAAPKMLASGEITLPTVRTASVASVRAAPSVYGTVIIRGFSNAVVSSRIAATSKVVSTQQTVAAIVSAGAPSTKAAASVRAVTSLKIAPSTATLVGNTIRMPGVQPSTAVAVAATVSVAKSVVRPSVQVASPAFRDVTSRIAATTPRTVPSTFAGVAETRTAVVSVRLIGAPSTSSSVNRRAFTTVAAFGAPTSAAAESRTARPVVINATAPTAAVVIARTAASTARGAIATAAKVVVGKSVNETIITAVPVSGPIRGPSVTHPTEPLAQSDLASTTSTVRVSGVAPVLGAAPIATAVDAKVVTRSITTAASPSTFVIRGPSIANTVTGVSAASSVTAVKQAATAPRGALAGVSIPESTVVRIPRVVTGAGTSSRVLVAVSSSTATDRHIADIHPSSQGVPGSKLIPAKRETTTPILEASPSSSVVLLPPAVFHFLTAVTPVMSLTTERTSETTVKALPRPASRASVGRSTTTGWTAGGNPTLVVFPFALPAGDSATAVTPVSTVVTLRIAAPRQIFAIAVAGSVPGHYRTATPRVLSRAAPSFKAHWVRHLDVTGGSRIALPWKTGGRVVVARGRSGRIVVPVGSGKKVVNG
jgi:hypothetical protein